MVPFNRFDLKIYLSETAQTLRYLKQLTKPFREPQYTRYGRDKPPLKCVYREGIGTARFP